MSDESYHDTDGNPVTLENLCRLEPMWAANVIRKLKRELETEKKRVGGYGEAFTEASTKLAHAGYKTLDEALVDARRGRKEKK